MAQIAPAVAPTAGTKRKRTNEVKFYAVRSGHRPGVYQTWPECLEQVKGFKGATFKTFPNPHDAARFVAGQNPSRPNDRGAHAQKFYAVREGRTPAIYTNWDDAQRQIKGWKRPLYRVFHSRAEAEAFMEHAEGANDDGSDSKDGGGQRSHDKATSLEDQLLEAAAGHEELNVAGPSGKRSKKSGGSAAVTARNQMFNSGSIIYDGYEAGFLLPPGAEDGFDANIVYNPTTGDVVFKTPSQRAATKVQATGMAPEAVLRVYTDGSALRNGQKGGYAGVGVYFGPGDSRNISEALPGPRQTNQRAELMAIVRALDMAPKDRNVEIITDSEYSINCANKWAEGWRRNGWKTANGKAVENKDLVESILSRVEERGSLGSSTHFEWIKGHANHLGNVEADRLAVSAARTAANVPAGYRKVIK